MAFVPLVILGVIGLAIWLRPWPLFAREEESGSARGQVPEWIVSRGFCKWVENQARARGLSARGVARPVPIECPKCHKSSNYFVYPDELC